MNDQAPPTQLQEEWGELFGSLSSAFAAGNRAAFVEILDRLLAGRAPTLYRDLSELTGGLRSALEQFQLTSRLATLAGKEVPDARVRLDHALKLTEDGAHRTLDLVEKSCPLSDGIAKEAAALVATLGSMRDVITRTTAFPGVLERIDDFLLAAQRDSEAVRANLTAVLMAQSYQDLSGQIIRGVITLVGEVEKTLAHLAELTGGHCAETSTAATPPSTANGFGPAIPGLTTGTVSEQNDVDALLADLGM